MTDAVDRVLAAGGQFTVCFCGRRMHGRACETCGYEIPAVREQRSSDEVAEWRRKGRAATLKRQRQRRWRKVRAR